MEKTIKTAGKVIAGFGATDITPWEGVQLAGEAAGISRPARFVRHRLYAKASVFKSNKTVCMVCLDVTAVADNYTEQIKHKIMELYDLEYGAIMVFAIQTHSSPAVGNVMLDKDFPMDLTGDLEYVTGSSAKYSDFVAEQAVEAVKKAFENMRPLKMDVKSGMRHGLAFCRRGIMRDGRAEMWPPYRAKENPLGPDGLLYMESPTDDEVGVVCFKDENMNFVSTLMHFTCHPVNDFCTPSLYNAVSSDWPGTWSERTQKLMGMESIPMVLNGCCGNINPWDPFTPDFIMDSEMMGEELTKLTERIILAMDFDGDDEPVTIDYYNCNVPLDYLEIPEDRMEEIQRQMARDMDEVIKDGFVDHEWFQAAWTYSILCLKKREPQFMYPVQIFRIGGLAIVGLPGEPFSDGQLDIKLRSVAPMTYVAHLANRYVGYLPHEKAYKFEGYECNRNVISGARVAPGSLEKICDQVVVGIKELFGIERPEVKLFKGKAE